MEVGARGEPITTLLHISDLHFGDRFITHETRFKRRLAFLPFVQGLYTHSYSVASALALRANHILTNRKAKPIPSCVVFTGDLTHGGAENEFRGSRQISERLCCRHLPGAVLLVTAVDPR